MLVVNHHIGTSECIFEAKHVSVVTYPQNAVPVIYQTAVVETPDGQSLELVEGIIYVMSEGKTVAKYNLNQCPPQWVPQPSENGGRVAA